MITDSYDKSDALITPFMCYKRIEKPIKTSLIIFSLEIYQYILSSFETKKIGTMFLANGEVPIYSFKYKGTEIAFYLSYISSTCASTFVEESSVITGASNYILFGSCGTLDKEKTEGKVIVPTEAYRDEGMSYHYKEKSDYIKIKNYHKLSSFFSKNDIPYIEGKVWTTDSFYRETKEQYKKRKEEGCIAVEMEIAGVEAVCEYYGLNLYAFLLSGDTLSDEGWRDRNNLKVANHSLDKLYFALEFIVSELKSEC